MDEITESRRAAVAQSIRPISASELQTLAKEIFASLDDPWWESLSAFMEAHPHEIFHHATTDDGVQVVYCHSQQKGLWFVPGSGMGILQARGLKMMNDAVERG